ncbi:hypothetical protein T484DRAFT_2259836 [Baffinella frigidus]|nr:hypothetical protein T484DRAFT_2259836 [Cryptophyta sp. CCMP2293]
MVDKWSPRPIEFSNLEAGRVALQDPQLLNEFFGRWEEVLNSVDAASQIRCSTGFARRLPSYGVNVLLIGESGAGKSLLVKVMTGDDSIVTSATQAGTSADKRYSSPCRVHWIDTPG